MLSVLPRVLAEESVVFTLVLSVAEPAFLSELQLAANTPTKAAVVIKPKICFFMSCNVLVSHNNLKLQVMFIVKINSCPVKLFIYNNTIVKVIQ